MAALEDKIVQQAVVTILNQIYEVGPTMRMDAVIGGGPDSPGYELVAEVTRGLLPVMEKLKIATATEIDVSSLKQRLRDEVVAAKGVVLSPGLIGSWSRKLP